jgi:hypothetical protein
VIEERLTKGGLGEDRDGELDRLVVERAVLLERLAALRDVSLEREGRITDLRAALAVLLKAEQRRAARVPPLDPISPTGGRRPSPADAARMTETERATWERELTRPGHPNRSGKVWETFEDFPPPRLRDRWRELRRGR